MQGIFEWRFDRRRITRRRIECPEEVNLIGVCGGLFTDRCASRFSSLAMHGNYVYFWTRLDWICLVWFSLVLARFPPTMR
jgi:hypothetical protein